MYACRQTLPIFPARTGHMKNKKKIRGASMGPRLARKNTRPRTWRSLGGKPGVGAVGSAYGLFVIFPAPTTPFKNRKKILAASMGDRAPRKNRTRQFRRS